MIPCSPPIPGALFSGNQAKGRAMLVGWLPHQGEYRPVVFTGANRARPLQPVETFVPDGLLPAPEPEPVRETVRVVHRTSDDGLWKAHP